MDLLANGRRIQVSTIVDDFTRECLDIVSRRNSPRNTGRTRQLQQTRRSFLSCKPDFTNSELVALTGAGQIRQPQYSTHGNE